MINVSEITAALVTLLKADSNLTQLKTRVSRSQFINMNPDLTPWVGIYKNSISYDPATLGRSSSSFKATIDLRLVAQMGGLKEEPVEDGLEQLVQYILDAIWADPTIGGKVLMVVGFDIQYSFEESASETQYFQWAIISIKAEVRTG